MLALPKFIYFTIFYLLFLTTADIYFGRISILPIAPTQFAVLMLVPIAGLLIMKDFFHQPKLLKVAYIIKNNSPLILSYFAVVVVSLLFSLLPGAYWEEGARWIFLINYGFIIFFFSMFLPMIKVVRSKYSFFLFSALLVIFSTIVYELYQPGFFSTVQARAAGLPGNSNLSALVIAFICAAALRYDIEKSKIYDSLVLVVAGLSIFFTLSRSGLIEFFVIFLSYLCFAIFSSKKRLTFSPKRFLGLLFFLAIIATFFLTVIPKVIEESNLFTSGSAQSRLGLLSGRGGVEDASGESRYKAILESLELINESPIVGHGTAHSRQMKELPHNMYLNQWVNNGILGLSCYVVFLITSFMTFRKRKFVPGQVFVLVAVVGSFFSHNVLDHRPFLILFGMMATLSLPKEKV